MELFEAHLDEMYSPLFYILPRFSLFSVVVATVHAANRNDVLPCTLFANYGQVVVNGRLLLFA